MLTRFCSTLSTGLVYRAYSSQKAITLSVSQSSFKTVTSSFVTSVSMSAKSNTLSGNSRTADIVVCWVVSRFLSRRVLSRVRTA